jgi:hypothetical protein
MAIAGRQRAVDEGKFTTDEREWIIDYVTNLKKDQIQSFLKEHGELSYGTKPDLIAIVNELLEDSKVTYTDLVVLLDKLAPWDKQHVFLYDGAESEIENWRNLAWVEEYLREKGLIRFLNRGIPLVLPENLLISSIMYDNTLKRLRIIAIERRDEVVRVEDEDPRSEQRNGSLIEFRAFAHVRHRGWVSFEWDLFENSGMLQVSQLPSGSKYEDVEKRFAFLIREWFPFYSFQKRNLHKAVEQLHKLGTSGQDKVLIQAIGYCTTEGDRIEGKSGSANDSVCNGGVVSLALDTVKDDGIGDSGNFYWLPDYTGTIEDNPLKMKVHVEIVASKNRINFRRPGREEDVRYVLQRVRSLSI